MFEVIETWVRWKRFYRHDELPFFAPDCPHRWAES
jgi:hypothetical protein